MSLLLAVEPATAQLDQYVWRDATPLDGAGVVTAFAADARDPALMLLGTRGGLWRSRNRGATWEKATSGMAARQVGAIAQDPRPGRRNTWFFVTDDFNQPDDFSGLFRSDDNTRTWTSVAASGPLQRLQDASGLLIDPATGNMVVSAPRGVIVSQDQGLSWRYTLGNESDDALVSTLAITGDGTVVAALHAGFDPLAESPPTGFYASSDGGINWQRIDDAPPALRTTRLSIVADPAAPALAYAYGELQSASTLVIIDLDARRAVATAIESPGFAPDTKLGRYAPIAVGPFGKPLIVGGVQLLTGDQLPNGPFRVVPGISNVVSSHLDQDRPFAYAATETGLFRFSLTDSDRTTDLTRLVSSLSYGDLAMAIRSDLLVGTTIERGLHYFMNEGGSSGAARGLSDQTEYQAATFIDETRYLVSSRAPGERTYSIELVRMNAASGRKETTGPSTETIRLISPPSGLGFSSFQLVSNGGPGPGLLIATSGRRVWRHPDFSALLALSGSEDDLDAAQAGWESFFITPREGDILTTRTDARGRLYLGIGAAPHGLARPRILRVDDPLRDTDTVEIPTPEPRFASDRLGGFALDRDHPDNIAFSISHPQSQSQPAQVFFTTSAGQSWREITGAGLPRTRIESIALIPQTGAYSVLVGTRLGLFGTDQIAGAATQWRRLAPGLAGSAAITALQYRASDGRIAVGTNGAGVVIGEPMSAPPAPDRGIISSGLYYDPERPGHGFSFRRFSDDSSGVYFYSYDEQGEPTWFLDTGADLGGLYRSVDLTVASFQYQDDRFPPQQTSFDDVRRLIWDASLFGRTDGCPERSAEAAVEIVLKGDATQWCVHSLLLPDPTSDIAGVWYLGPEDQGWGLTIDARGTVMVIIIFYYDANGRARWALGQSEDWSFGAVVRMREFSMSCTGCAANDLSSRPIGDLTIDKLESGETVLSVDLTTAGEAPRRWRRTNHQIIRIGR